MAASLSLSTDMPDIWSFVAIFAKWPLYLGVLGASGTVFCTLVFALERTRALAASFAVIGIFAAALVFMLKGAALTGDATGITDPEMLGLLWATQSGTALTMQAGGLLVLLVGLAFGRAGLGVSALGGLAALGSFVMAGHIADRGNVLVQAVLMAHLIGAAFWIGILTPLRRLADDDLVKAAVLGRRFGQIASIFVPALILAGGVMTYVLVGSLAAMIGTGYGQALVLKVGFVAGLLGFAAVNKLRLVPGLEAGDTECALRLSRSIRFEWVLVLAILGVTAALTSILTLPG